MARRNKHTQEELKTMILSAAQEIVTNQGFSALTVRKIAANIDYTVGSIYMVFTNMDELILHLKAGILDDLTRQLEQLNHCPPELYLEEMAKAYLHLASNNYNQWSMLFEHRLPDEATIPQWYQDKAEDSFHRVQAQFKRLTPEYPDTQLERAARALWCGIQGICTLSLGSDLNHLDIYNVEGNIMLLVRNFVRGWLNTANA